MKKETHETRLLDYLRKYKKITSLEAIRDLGNTRLSATVYNLRRKGHDISTKPVKVKTRWNTMTEVAEYHYSESMTEAENESRKFWWEYGKR